MINLVEKKSCRRILLLSSTGAMGAHCATVDDRLICRREYTTYEVALVVFNAVNAILSYLALKYGFVPESVYVISIVVEISIMWSRIRLLGKVY